MIMCAVKNGYENGEVSFHEIQSTRSRACKTTYLPIEHLHQSDLCGDIFTESSDTAGKCYPGVTGGAETESNLCF